MRGLAEPVRAHLDRRLSRGSGRPLAVALSGGGDSLALTLIADAWAREAGREFVVLTVDHRLQAGSAAWTAACARTAARLGRPFQALAWEGEKPARGLPAAARAGRHRLLADAARQAGAVVILMGHTADDVLEARRMREAGATTPDPRVWSPSPAWPEGRGVFLLRPLLDIRRAALRDWLAAHGETWIEDPANDDLRYARPRARRNGGADEMAEPAEPAPLTLVDEARERAGCVTLRREALRQASAVDVARFVGLACVCAGGGDRRPAGGRIARLAEALQGEGPVVATLAGARVEASGDEVHIFREAGEAARGGLAPLTPEAGVAAVWDGRFEIAGGKPGLTICRLTGLAARLAHAEQQALRELPAAARGGLPAVVRGEGASCPLLGLDPDVQVRSLVGERLRAAAGLIGREPD